MYMKASNAGSSLATNKQHSVDQFEQGHAFQLITPEVLLRSSLFLAENRPLNSQRDNVICIH